MSIQKPVSESDSIPEIVSPETLIAELQTKIEIQKTRMDFTFEKRRFLRYIPLFLLTTIIHLFLLFYLLVSVEDIYLPLFIGIFVTVFLLHLYSLIMIIYSIVSNAVKKSRNADAVQKIKYYMEQIEALNQQPSAQNEENAQTTDI